jgi:hypothetical protein
MNWNVGSFLRCKYFNYNFQCLFRLYFVTPKMPGSLLMTTQPGTNEQSFDLNDILNNVRVIFKKI